MTGQTGLRLIARSAAGHPRQQTRHTHSGRPPSLPESARVVHLMVLTRVHDVDPQLAHAIRVRVRAGVSDSDADRFIALLRQLPIRKDG